jgi:DNA-binding CsgD family transcriptional regulator
MPVENLSIEDIQTLNQCIQQLYSFHNLATFGVDSLAIIDRLVSSDWPLFNLTNTRTGQLDLTYLPNFTGLPPEVTQVLEDILSQDRDNHPIAQNMPQTLHGAYKLSDFISQPELHRKEGLYQQFLRLLNTEDQMLFFLPDVKLGSWSELVQADTILTGYILNRHECSFTERDRLILNLLRPHLFQAYTNTQQHDRLQQQTRQLQRSLDYLGTIVLDGEGWVRSIAPQATIWLENYFTKPTSTRQLPDNLRSWVKHQIACLTQNTDLPQACLPLRLQQAGRELTIRLVIEQIGERYLLLLEEQNLCASNSLALLGLSLRETQVLELVMQGKDNNSIATQLNISSSTVRKHLENIYSQLGVHSRTAAIAQVLTQLGFSHSLPIS